MCKSASPSKGREKDENNSSGWLEAHYNFSALERVFGSWSVAGEQGDARPREGQFSFYKATLSAGGKALKIVKTELHRCTFAASTRNPFQSSCKYTGMIIKNHPWFLVFPFLLSFVPSFFLLSFFFQELFRAHVVYTFLLFFDLSSTV